MKQTKKNTGRDNVSDISARKKILDTTFAQIDKEFGKGSVMLLGQAPKVDVEAIPTGSILVDRAIGCDGFPRGRIIEIFGPESSGKTTLTLHAIAQAQAKGGVCAFIDAEHALNPEHARSLGVNVDELIISQPDFGEQALNIAEMLIRSGAVDLVVVDSVAALVPKAEIEGDMGDVHVGLQARLMSQALRKLTPVVYKANSVLIFINQIRHKINTMAFANKETTSGGNALKFYASLRIDVRRIASLKKGDVHIGNRLAIKIVKNKVAPPFKRVLLDLIFGEGISPSLDLLDAALHYKLVKQAGAWYSQDDKNFAQGRDQALVYIKKNTEFATNLRKNVYIAIKEEKAQLEQG
ncbi:recombinase RecA [bacterium]|jgi:recombination protein RecA|nr:recombinase RecA [bacterium]MBT4577437.1 recombinase RecA [bacterium]MBT5345978.1 recombinase RecA [bacterium]MBT6130764.1 recombinase RecA [bacterium]